MQSSHQLSGVGARMTLEKETPNLADKISKDQI
jgi:hypothetical protein